MAKSHAVVIFVDIRHFTRWVNNVETTSMLEEFLTVFYEILIKNFPQSFLKRLGDGALIILTQPSPPHASALEENLGLLLNSIAMVEQRFANLCIQVETRYGHTAPLQLGWGITRGTVECVFGATDFIGTIINEASRLCDLARPAGVVIDKEDFPRLPSLVGTPWRFHMGEYQLKGYPHATPLWVSDAIALES